MTGGPYTNLTAEEIAAKLRGIQDARPIDHPSRHALWERCWRENSVAPYFNVGNAHEHEQFVELRDRLFRTHLAGVQEVVEFGCGVGENLLALPGRRLRGYDWSEAAVERCRARGIEADVFDMFNPAPVRLEGCGVFTVHALEQVGDHFHPMAHLLMRSRPKVVIHIEPIYELYDPLDLNDYLAMKYHEARGYLKGFLPWLKTFGKNLYLDVSPATFGNIHHRAYSVITWSRK